MPPPQKKKKFKMHYAPHHFFNLRSLTPLNQIGLYSSGNIPSGPIVDVRLPLLLRVKPLEARGKTTSINIIIN